MKGLIAVAATVLATSLAWGSNVGVNISIGTPLPPPPQPAPIVIEEPPSFIYTPEVGLYVGIGLPYDIFFISNVYYVYRGNRWYYAPRYDGPWQVTSYRRLPEPLRVHKIERIRHYRDREYRVYAREPERYRGRYYRPERHQRGEGEIGYRGEHKKERPERGDEGRHERRHDR